MTGPTSSSNNRMDSDILSVPRHVVSGSAPGLRARVDGLEVLPFYRVSPRSIYFLEMLP